MIKQSEETKLFLDNLVTQTDIKRIYDRFTDYASFEDMDNFRNKVEPLAVRCSQDLDKYCVENA